MSSLNDVSRSIGQLEGKLGAIAEQVRANSNAHTHNTEEINKRIDRLTTAVTTLVTKVEQTDKDVAQLKPAVNKLNNARQRMLGIVGVGTILVSGAFNIVIGYLKGSL